MIRHLLLTLILTLFFGAQTQASTIDDAGATRLKTLFSELLQEQKETASLSGRTIKTQGDITIEQASNYYAVTLPTISIINEDKTTLDIGLIALNAIPTKNPDNWKMSIALPTPFLYSDKDNNPEIRIDFGTQRTGGIWNGKLKGFSKLLSQYQDIQITHYKNDKTLSIKKLGVATNLDKTKNKNWLGDVTIETSGIKIETEETPNFFSLKEASLKIQMKEEKGELVNHTLRLKYNDFSFSGSSYRYRDLFPLYLDMKADLHNLPIQALIKAGKSILQSKSKNTGAAQVALLHSMLTLPQIISDAGTTLTINQATYGNNLYTTDMNTEVKANPESIIGVTGALTLRVAGLIKIINKLEENVKQAPSTAQRKIKNGIARLRLLNKIGEKDEKNDIKTCTFSLDENTKILINGEVVSDLATLLQND